jgi:hypothetical protein
MGGHFTGATPGREGRFKMERGFEMPTIFICATMLKCMTANVKHAYGNACKLANMHACLQACMLKCLHICKHDLLGDYIVSIHGDGGSHFLELIWGERGGWQSPGLGDLRNSTSYLTTI